MGRHSRSRSPYGPRKSRHEVIERHEQKKSRHRKRSRSRTRSRSRDHRRHSSREERVRSERENYKRKKHHQTRSRSRSLDRKRRVHSKSRSRLSSRSPSFSPEIIHIDSAKKITVTEADVEKKNSEEQLMAKMMGFSSFDTTKGKKVEGNDVGEVHVILKRKYRQYMNRKGGFNRPLDNVA